MPNYEYHCEKCGENFEIWQKISDEPVRLCPREGCGGQVHRGIGGGGGFILKGGGFYATDYRSSDYKKKSASETKSSDSGLATGKAPESKAESKPAAAKKD